MRSPVKIFFFLCFPLFGAAQFQHNQLDSMFAILKNAANDTIRMDAYYKLGSFYDDVNLDSSVYYGEKGASIARDLHLKLNEAEMIANMSWPLGKMGNYPRALKLLNQALEIANDPSNQKHCVYNLIQQDGKTVAFDR